MFYIKNQSHIKANLATPTLNVAQSKLLINKTYHKINPTIDVTHFKLMVTSVRKPRQHADFVPYHVQETQK